MYEYFLKSNQFTQSKHICELLEFETGFSIDYRSDKHELLAGFGKKHVNFRIEDANSESQLDLGSKTIIHQSISRWFRNYLQQ